MGDLLLALWPLFALILSGLAFRRSGFLGDAFWPAAERLNYFILFPALLFRNLAIAPLTDPALLRLAVVVLITLAVAWGVLLAAKRVRRWPAERFGPLAQGILRFNTYLGLAAVASLFGSTGLAQATVVLAVMVPTVNLLSVWALSAQRGRHPLDLLRPVVTNPLVLACLAGIGFAWFGFELPLGTGNLLDLLAGASLPLGLLCVGAALKLGALREETSTLLFNSFARLIMMPALALMTAFFLALPSQDTMLLVLFFALPTAPTAYVLTRQLGGDATLMAGLITLQTMLAAASLPLVLAWG